MGLLVLFEIVFGLWLYDVLFVNSSVIDHFFVIVLCVLFFSQHLHRISLALVVRTDFSRWPVLPFFEIW